MLIAKTIVLADAGHNVTNAHIWVGRFNMQSITLIVPDFPL